MRLFILSLFACVSLGALEPKEAFERLKEGNKRFRDEKSTCPDRTKERRLEQTMTQEPFAAIVGCSDSRVSPEILFDQGIGDLFVVRVAGNVVGPVELDSVDYSVKYLHSSLIVVLGHENCGAVAAVMQGVTQDIESVAKLIQPAIQKTKEESIKANAKLVAEGLRKSSLVASYIKEGKVKVVAGYYNFHSGEVEWLD